MDYLILTYTCLSLGIGFFIACLLYKKRIPVFYFIFVVLIIIVITIRLTDSAYYKELFSGIKNIDMCLFIASSILLIIELFEIVLLKGKNKDILKIKKGFYSFKQKYDFINSFNIDIALYDEKKLCYALNDHFKNTLNLKSRKIDIDSFEKLIINDDIIKFRNNESTSSFRIEINSKLVNFESTNNDLFKVIYRSAERKEIDNIVTDYNDLDNSIEILNNDHKFYAFVLIDITRILENNNLIKNEIFDEDLKELIILRYLNNILNEKYKDNLKIYRLANLEFAILILDEVIYNNILKDLENGSSELINCDIIIKDIKYLLKSKVAIVSSTYLKEYENIIALAYEIMQIVCQENYKEDYIVYKNGNIINKAYNLNDLGIDLENDIKNIINKNE